QAEDGIRDRNVTEFRRVLFRSRRCSTERRQHAVPVTELLLSPCAGELEWQAVSVVADRLPMELRARSGDHVTNPPPHLAPLPGYGALREDDGRFRSRADRCLRLRGAIAGSVTAR